MVARVLSAAFALCHPHILVLLRDGVVDVAAHKLTALVKLLATDVAAYDEGLVQSYQCTNPWVDEQVVTDGNLTRRGETVVEEHNV